MTKDFYRTGNYETNHRTFGGLVTSFDFEGHTSMSKIADRIMSDLAFDRQCRLNAENRDRNKKNKGGE